MNFDTNLELQLEILTLLKNIEKFNKLSWGTSQLENRLEFCQAQLSRHLKASNDDFHFPLVNEHRFQNCI